MRLLAIGLDGVGLEDVVRQASLGYLPTLANIVLAGSPQPVGHPAAYRAELPWTTLLTGKTPQETGYWGTIRFDADSYRVCQAGAYRGEPFYANLGVPVVVMDVPHSVPWPGVEGLQVSAWGAHSPQHPPASLPRGLLAELDVRFGPHPAFDLDSQPGWHSEDYNSHLVDALVEGASRRARAFSHLLARQPDWGFAMVVFSELHSAGHLLWHGQDRSHPLFEAGAEHAGERYRAVFTAVDAAVAAVASAAPPDAVLAIFSVHGTTTNANDLPAGYLVPELLQRDHFGWARFANPSPRAAARQAHPDGRVPLGTLLQRQLVGPEQLTGPAKPNPLAILKGASRRRWRATRQRFGRSSWPRLPVVVARTEMPPTVDAPDDGLDYLGACRYRSLWPMSRVFVLPSFSDAHLRVNLAGREGQGLVEVEDYDEALVHIEGLLREIRHPTTGLPLPVELERPRGRDRLGAHGPPADLIARWSAPVAAFDHPRIGRIGPLPFLRTGEHGGPGFVSLARAVAPGRSFVPAFGSPFGRPFGRNGIGRADIIDLVALFTEIVTASAR